MLHLSGLGLTLSGEQNDKESDERAIAQFVEFLTRARHLRYLDLSFRWAGMIPMLTCRLAAVAKQSPGSLMCPGLVSLRLQTYGGYSGHLDLGMLPALKYVSIRTDKSAKVMLAPRTRRVWMDWSVEGLLPRYPSHEQLL